MGNLFRTLSVWGIPCRIGFNDRFSAVFHCLASCKDMVLLQYLHRITPVLALDYSSTSIGLLQYFYWITPVLEPDSVKVLHGRHKL